MASMLISLKENAETPVLLHLDHCRDTKLAMQCIDAGWDSIMFDGSALTFEENICLTKEIASYAHSNNCETEGELGTIAGTEDEISVSNSFNADYEHSLIFIKQTGVDAFAPAIGTAHGRYTKQPVIHFDIVKSLSSSTETPIVIHGGSGLDEEVFKKLIRCGGAKINISTALKAAYLESVCSFFKGQYPIDPLALDTDTEKALYSVALKHMKLFSEANL